MLKNVDKLLTGDLLKVLCDMGHGDELVIADANFPASSLATRLISGTVKDYAQIGLQSLRESR